MIVVILSQQAFECGTPDSPSTSLSQPLQPGVYPSSLRFAADMCDYEERPLRVANPHTGEMHDFNWWGDDQLTGPKQVWTYCGTEGGRDTIFVACDGRLRMFDVRTGEMLWERSYSNCIRHSPAYTCPAVSYILIYLEMRFA